MYIRGCLGCILVADATNEKTLKSLVEWKRIIVENLDYTGEDYRSPFIVLENKADLIKSSETEYSDVFKQKEMSLEEFVKENGINKGFLTSAKDNLNLDEAFSYLSDRILEQLEENPKKDKESNFDTVRNETLKYKLKNGKKEKKCC